MSIKKIHMVRVFLPLLIDKKYDERDVLVTYYNPMWGSRGLNRGVYAQDKKYKLYKSCFSHSWL